MAGKRSEGVWRVSSMGGSDRRQVSSPCVPAVCTGVPPTQAPGRGADLTTVSSSDPASTPRTEWGSPAGR